MAPTRSANKKQQQLNPPSAWDEVWGIFLIGLGLLCFLALISYTPKDLPAWVFFSRVDRPNVPVENFIGHLGVLYAGFSYFFFGAASYLLPAFLLGFGAAKILLRLRMQISQIYWLAAFVISGACLCQLQTWFFQHWGLVYNIDGPGGWWGHFLGATLVEGLIGKIGAVICFGIIYAASAIYVAGLHPALVVEGVRTSFWKLLEDREARRHARGNLEEKLAIDQKKLRRATKKIEKELGEKVDDTPPSEEAELLSAAAELSEVEPKPEPKIIDSSVRRREAAARTKKSLEQRRSANLDVALSTELRFKDYQLPCLDLLDSEDDNDAATADPNDLLAVQNKIVQTLADFGIVVTAGDITRGPTITRYELYPSQGLRVNRITSLEADIARATCAEKINIIAPIPGKDTVGIEIANSNKVMVTLRELLEDGAFGESKAKIPLALGKDVYGNTVVGDLAQMPHLLVAGATGSGKSVCINSIIASILYQFTPDQLRLIMIDPKVVEMQVYNSLPHLVIPVVTDPKKVLLALRWVINEMERRYKIFAAASVRNIHSFNQQRQKESQKRGTEEQGALGLDHIQDRSAQLEGAAAHPIHFAQEPEQDEVPDHLPYIVVIIDELADLMQTAPADVESAIARITQMARAAGIHLIVATQTPRADVITGVIKANIPSRIAFQVASKLDSRVILDSGGAERLVGKGDMLYLPPGSSRLLRSQGALITDEEIQRLIDHAAEQFPPSYENQVQESIEQAASGDAEEVSDEDEELIEKCLEVIRQEKKASTSMLQRRLRLGYTRAARIVDILESRGIIGPGEGARPREILIDLDAPVAFEEE